jgi:hypothetical protein
MIPESEKIGGRYLLIKLPPLPKHESVFKGVVGAGVVSLGLKICSLHPASWGYAGLIAMMLLIKRVLEGLDDADTRRKSENNKNKPLQNVL